LPSSRASYVFAAIVAPGTGWRISAARDRAAENYGSTTANSAMTADRLWMTLR
jgi:hypothetical protein